MPEQTANAWWRRRRRTLCSCLLAGAQHIEQRQSQLYVRKFAAAMRALDKDPDPLTEAELRELVDTFGAVAASGDAAAAADADANDDEDADADGDGAEKDGDDDE